MSDEERSERGSPAESALVHRYVDGDLDPAERSALLARAATDPSLAKQIEGLIEIGALTERAALDAPGEPFDADAMFAKIEASIAMEESSEGIETRARPELRVLPGGKSESKGDGKPEIRATPAKPSMPPDVRRRRTIGIVIGALAVAAAAVIAFTQGGSDAPEVAVEDAPVAPETIDDPLVESPELAAVEPARTEVLEVDFGTNVGSIFSVEGDDGERYVVIWVDESDTVSN
jgi:hypothetical protein